MGRRKQFFPEDIIDRAIEVFLTKGYEATAVKDLVAATRLHPGSLYNTFGSKRHLYELSLKRFVAISTFYQTIAEAETAPPRTTIEKVFLDQIEQVERGERPKGCLISNTAVELGGVDDELSAWAASYLQKMEDRICTLIERGQTLGEFTSSRPARKLARTLFSTLQGMQLLAKVNPDPNTLRDASELALSLLDEATG